MDWIKLVNFLLQKSGATKINQPLFKVKSIFSQGKVSWLVFNLLQIQKSVNPLIELGSDQAPKFPLQPSEQHLWKKAFMSSGKKETLSKIRKQTKATWIYQRTQEMDWWTMEKCILYFGVMNETLKFSVQRKDSMKEERLESREKMCV